MDGADLDPTGVLGALGVSDVDLIEQATGGTDTLIWRVEHGGRADALRLFRAEQAAVCRREVAAMRAAADGGIPVPRIHAEGVWQRRPALLLSWCPGRPLGEELRGRPWRLWTLGHAFGRMQAWIHRVPAPAALRRDPDAWIAWAGDDEPLRARLRAVALREDALLHLDYHPLNALADAGGLTAVLDWANARAGDPGADLARTVTILRLAPAAPGVLPPRRLLRVFELGWRRGYRREAGPPTDMPLFYAWAGAAMVRDLGRKIGRPGVWLQPRHLDPIRRWTLRRKRRAGLPI